MLQLLIVGMLLLYLPFRLSRSFPPLLRFVIVLIVAAKAVLIVIFHAWVVRTTEHPIILDASVDAKVYYDFGEAFLNHHPFDITHEDLVRERGAESHLGYYVVNLAAFKLCPPYPMLFLRLCKLLLFHVALGMLAVTWFRRTSPTRAMWGYLLVGVILYQLFYDVFRNTKDDMIVSMFMMIMAMADGTISRAGDASPRTSRRRVILSWIAIILLTWCISEMRYYMGLAIVGGFALHLITGMGLKPIYRIMLGLVIAAGFLLLTQTAGFRLVQDRGGVSAVSGALLNFYGMFKVLVSPLPWQHGELLLIPAHTIYLFLLGPVLWSFCARFRANLDWKLYAIIAVALVVGGYMENFNPRKRYVMYPVFVSWMVMAGRRRESFVTDHEPFDPNAYFSQQRHAYA